MRRSSRVLASTGLCVSGLALVAPGASLAGTLDQQQTVSDTTAVIHSGSTTAQTFTAGLSGGVDQVDLKLAASGSPTSYLSVEIRGVSGGSPGATVLASRSVPASSVPGTAAFVPINFAPPAPVAAGTQYAIVAYSSTSSGIDYSWSISSANPYAGGNDFFTATTPPSGTWTPLASFDLAFKTYVAPSMATTTTPTTTTPTGQRAAALKKCKHKHGHKRKKCKKRASLLPV